MYRRERNDVPWVGRLVTPDFYGWAIQYRRDFVFNPDAAPAGVAGSPVFHLYDEVIPDVVACNIRTGSNRFICTGVQNIYLESLGPVRAANRRIVRVLQNKVEGDKRFTIVV